MKRKIDFSFKAKCKNNLGDFVIRNYHIKQRNFKEYLNLHSKRGIKVNKNHIGFSDLIFILVSLIETNDVYKTSIVTGFSKKSICKLLEKISYTDGSRGKEIFISKIDNKRYHTIRIIDLDVFINLKLTFHDSKKMANNPKLKGKNEVFFKFVKKKNDEFIESLHDKKTLIKKPQQSMQSLIDECKTIFENINISVQTAYNGIKNKQIENYDILPYLSKNGQKTKNPKPKKLKKKAIGKSIEERPETINTRVMQNDYELDTVVGVKTDKYVFLTLINRQSRKFYFTLTRRDSKSVAMSLEKLIIKNNLVIDSLIIDNGSENYKLDLIKEIGQIYHCHPYCSSEKGSIENCHKLLRRFFKKGKSLDKYVGLNLDEVDDFINNFVRHTIKQYSVPMSANQYEKLYFR